MGATVAERRIEVAELVADVCLGDRMCTVGDLIAAKHRHAVGAAELVDTQTELIRELFIEHHQLGGSHRCRLRLGIELGKFSNERIVGVPTHRSSVPRRR